MKIMVSPSGTTHVGYGGQEPDNRPTGTHCGKDVTTRWTVAPDSVQRDDWPTCRPCQHAGVAAPNLRLAAKTRTAVVGPVAPPATNQGTPTIEQALDIVAMADIQTIAAALWIEAKNHGLEPTRRGAACECLAIEAISRLLHMGYRIEAPHA